jgi:hypothetical protein
MEVDDGLPLLGGEPVVARDQRVVLVGLAVPLAPGEELPPGDADPADEPIGRDLCLLRPLPDEVND